MRGILLLVCILAAFFIAGGTLLAQIPSPSDGHQLVEFFPGTGIFPHSYADGIAPRLGVSKDFSSAMIHGDMGGHIPVLGLNLSGLTIQCGTGAAVLTSLIKRPGLLQVVTADFLVEFPIDIGVSELVSLRTGYGHFSAHFADDGIEILGRSSINYAKDYVMLFGSCRIPGIEMSVYGGGHWYFHSLPGDRHRWMVQAGIEGGNVEVFPDVIAYAALDLRLKSEVGWAATQSYQCGLRLFQRGERAVRLAYTFRAGIDDREQFYTERRKMHLVGVYLDF